MVNPAFFLSNPETTGGDFTAFHIIHWGYTRNYRCMALGLPHQHKTGCLDVTAGKWPPARRSMIFPANGLSSCLKLGHLCGISPFSDTATFICSKICSYDVPNLSYQSLIFSYSLLYFPTHMFISSYIFLYLNYMFPICYRDSPIYFPTHWWRMSHAITPNTATPDMHFDPFVEHHPGSDFVVISSWDFNAT